MRTRGLLLWLVVAAAPAVASSWILEDPNDTAWDVRLVPEPETPWAVPLKPRPLKRREADGLWVEPMVPRTGDSPPRRVPAQVADVDPPPHVRDTAPATRESPRRPIRAWRFDRPVDPAQILPHIQLRPDHATLQLATADEIASVPEVAAFVAEAPESYRTSMTDSPAGPLERADAWLAARRRWVLAALLSVAALCRLVAGLEVMETPVLSQHRHVEMDMMFFGQWARQLVEDEEGMFSREVMHPFHTWHRKAAEAHFAKHPEVSGGDFAKLPEAQKILAMRRLWNGWYGGRRYHQEPLYAHLIALVFQATGSFNLGYVYILQLLVGVVVIGLLYGVTRIAFGDLAALLAGGMAVGWIPLTHYEMVLLRVTWISLFGLALLYVFARMQVSSRTLAQRPLWHWLGLGVLIGLASAMKLTFAVLAVGLMGLVLWPQRREVVAVALRAGLVAVGVLVVLTPFFVRNYVVDAPLFSLASVGPVTFAGTNFPGYIADYGWYPFDDPDTLAGIMADSDGGLLSTVGATLARWDSKLDYLGLLWEKFVAVWHWYETPNNTSVYFTALYSRLLGVMQHLVSAGWVMPAGVLGLVLCWRRPRQAIWWWYLLSCLAPLIVFYNLSRFRVPLVLGLMPFAAFAALQVVRWFQTGKAGKALLALAVFVVGTVWMHRDFKTPRLVIDHGVFIGAMGVHYTPIYNQMLKEGRRQDAIEMMAEFFEKVPPFVYKLQGNRPPEDDREYHAAKGFLSAFQVVGALATRVGDRRAKQWVQRARDIKASIASYDAWMKAQRQAR